MANDFNAAPVENVDAAALSGTAAPIAHNNMSFWDLFINADIVVQLVILGMLACSIWCWSIVFKKTSLFKMINFKSSRFEASFWSGTSLEQLYEKTKGKANHPMAEIFVAAMDEVQKAKLTASADAKSNFLARLERTMHLTKNRVADKLQDGLSVLAIIGSNMPFIGLFGTVWGIMNSFTSIASSKNISLAIVAPGIAEALFATAIGLVVAIPAVIFYNKISNQFNRIMSKLDDFCDEFITLISRQLDEGRL